MLGFSLLLFLVTISVFYIVRMSKRQKLEQMRSSLMREESLSPMSIMSIKCSL
ncbi:MAG: hypothetical protein IBX43_02260 [Campylobacterales bacterium]|nr:hypothetical protein [Campylobacterales bacterium]